MLKQWGIVKGSILLIVILIVVLYVKTIPVESPHKIIIPPMDIVVQNDLIDWKPTDESFRIPYIKIKSIGFATDKTDLFIRYDLAAAMPKNGDPRPKYNGEKLTGVNFYLYLDENYFDSSGQKNPGGPDAELKMSFYGTDKADVEAGKIIIDGKLVAGGPGFNYFVARFPYRQILFNQTGPYVVFSSYSVAITRLHAAGGSIFDMNNLALAADGKNPSEIKIKLSPKK